MYNTFLEMGFFLLAVYICVVNCKHGSVHRPALHLVHWNLVVICVWFHKHDA